MDGFISWEFTDGTETLLETGEGNVSEYGAFKKTVNL